MIVTIMFVTHKFGSVGPMSATSRTPVSRRERPAKSALSRDAIVEAAIAVLTSEDPAKLTMRRLAADLDTGPASLYVYVRNTTELHALVIDRLLADLDVEWMREEGWRLRLRRLLTAYVHLLVGYPALARSALHVWPEGPHYLDLVELVLRLLRHGGVPDAQAAWGVDVLLQFATGMAAEWGARGESDEQDVEDLAGLLDSATPERHPILASIGAETLVGGEQEARRDWALDAVISGVVATPRTDEDA